MASWLIRLSPTAVQSGSRAPSPPRITQPPAKLFQKRDGRDQGGCVPREGLVAGRGQHREFGS